MLAGAGALLAGGLGEARAAERPGEWSIGVGALYGLVSPDQINERTRIDNLALGTAVDEFENYREIYGDLRYGIAPRLTFETRAGFLWQEHEDGSVTRRVSSKTLFAGLLYDVLASDSRSLALAGGGGLLIGAKLSGRDPLGGIEESKTGWMLEGGLEGAQFLGRAWSLRARGSWRLARVTDLSRDGTDLDWSGGVVHGGLRFHFR